MRPVARLLQERQGHEAGTGGPCFAHVFGNASLSDVDVRIEEEPVPLQEAASPRAGQPAAAVTLPANVTVLYSLSEFVRNKVDNWSDEQQQQGQRRQLLLLVPPGQVTTGRLLVEAMYMDAPDLSHLGLGELLALLALADSYSVPKVVGFAAEALADATASGQLPWEDVLAVLGLPDTCLKLPGCGAVRIAAVVQLQQELGDLEAVWNSTDKSERLLSLPLAALKQLLADDFTKADSEDTVVYTIQRWMEQHSPRMDNVQQQHLEALGQVVRLPHCSPSYIASAAAAECHWLPQYYAAADLTIACRLAADAHYKLYAGEPAPLLHSQWARRHAAWSLSKRPNSSSCSSVAGHLEFDWRLPIEEAQELIMQVCYAKEGEEVVLDGPQVRMWRGRRWGLQATFSSKGIGLYVTVWQGSPCTVSLVTARTGVVRYSRTPAWSGSDGVVVEGTCGRVGDPALIYFTNHQHSWSTILEMLRDRGFLQGNQQGDGQELHFQAKVSEVQ